MADFKKMVMIKADDLRNDIKDYAKANNTTYSMLLCANGISNSIISHAIERYKLKGGKVDGIGEIKQCHIEEICKLCGFDVKKYVTSESVEEKQKVSELTSEELGKLIYKAVYSAVKHAWENEEE